MAEERELKVEFTSAKFTQVVTALTEKLGEGSQNKYRDLYYDFPDGRLHTIDHALRLRYAEGFPKSFCFKTIFYVPNRKGQEWFVDEESSGWPVPANFLNQILRRLNLGEEVENTLTFSDEAIKAHLEKIGLQPYVDIKKHRVTFVKGETRFMVDSIDQVGVFLEVEDPKSPRTALEELAMPFPYKEIRSGFTHLYLKRVLGKDPHGNEKFYKEPTWNVLPAEKELYDLINR